VLLAFAAVLALFGTRVLLHPGSAAVGSNPANDFQIMTWSFAWWPWAFGHGVNPLHTPLLWPPDGFPTLWITSIPVPSLVALPLSTTAGPLVAYNVLMFAAVPLATAAAYLLCHELTANPWASAFGALVFGLSPYMLGHSLSQHLNLLLVFPLPLLALLGVRLHRRRITRTRFVAWSAVLLIVLAGTSLELFVDLTVVLAVAGVVTMLAARRFTTIGIAVALAYACCLPLLVPIAIVALESSHGPLGAPPATFATDLWNFVLPTPTLLLGKLHSLGSPARHFVGNIGERDGYLGLPLLVVCGLALRRREAWPAGLLAAVGLILSLGPVAAGGGRRLVVNPLSPARLPLLTNVLPARFALFVALAAACLCSLWLARPGSRVVRVAVAAVVGASLLPNFAPASHVANAWAVSDSFAWSTPRVAAGFVDKHSWTRLVPRGSNVLVLPTRDRTLASYWQVKAKLRFRLAIPGTPFVPREIAGEPAVARLVDDVLLQLDGPRLAAARLRAFLIEREVRAVVVEGRSWIDVTRRATGSRPTPVGDVLVFPVALALRPIAATGELDHVAWLYFDGARAHVRVSLRGHITTVSSADGDAEDPSVATGPDGATAVAFTEWSAGRVLMRVAANRGRGWDVTTLDENTLPIWTPRVAFTAGGAIVAGWVDDRGSSRRLRTAIEQSGSWQPTPDLDRGQGLGVFDLRASGGAVTATWVDARAAVSRVRTATFDGTHWLRSRTLRSGFDRITGLASSSRR
jgi:hypothetical protein